MHQSSLIVLFEETYNTTLASFAAFESIKQGSWVNVNELFGKKKKKKFLLN